MNSFHRFTVITALGLASSSLSQAPMPRPSVAFYYYPNRPGAQAYLQGGAMAASTGSMEAMLFNPAGLAEMPGRLTASVESGWSSEADYVPRHNLSASSQFLPLQYVAVASHLNARVSIGAFFAQPTRYRLEFPPIPVTTIEHPDGTGEFLESSEEWTQTSVGLAAAISVKERLVFGGVLEWRRAFIRDEFFHTVAEGHAEAWRYTLGAIWKANCWNLGVVAQSKYDASGEVRLDPQPVIVDLFPWEDLPPRYLIEPIGFPFSAVDPATIRFGIKTAEAFGRFGLHADAEFKDFEEEDGIERWQFYGGGTLRLTSTLQVGAGAFTFAKNYRSSFDGPQSETFLTIGGAIEFARLRLSDSYMDGDLLTDVFAGRRFVNFAVSYTVL